MINFYFYLSTPMPLNNVREKTLLYLQRMSTNGILRHGRP